MNYRLFVHIQVAMALLTIALSLVWSHSAIAEPLPSTRGEVLLQQSIWLALPLLFALFLVMLKRGRSADLILGFASRESANGLETAVLGNTIEQTLLAGLALAAFVASCPSTERSTVHAFIVLFLSGRLFFYLGYRLNPMWRIYGFSLNFYSSVALIALAAYFSAAR